MDGIKAVVHVKKAPYEVYIGRAVSNFPNSIWHNPYRLKNPSDPVERARVLSFYRAYLLNNPSLLERLEELSGKTLGCWCAPLPCHGDVLAELLSARLKDKDKEGA
jgi:hypothetical protein